ncbi:MAG: hypothetical protein MUD14_13315 [Hydrococcus sp. Prado102]|jgi:uncharacterized membrane protein YjjP (DUF1212 family)|nr:hypothetical protein [Hydrococcus sp. Prado102]
MNNYPRIPETATIERHVTKMNELCQRMDKHIADLEELNTRLDEEFYQSPYGIYRQKK